MNYQVIGIQMFQIRILTQNLLGGDNRIKVKTKLFVSMESLASKEEYTPLYNMHNLSSTYVYVYIFNHFLPYIIIFPVSSINIEIVHVFLQL